MPTAGKPTGCPSRPQASSGRPVFAAKRRITGSTAGRSRAGEGLRRPVSAVGGPALAAEPGPLGHDSAQGLGGVQGAEGCGEGAEQEP